MNNFDYSNNALSAKADFYGKRAMVYVEGKDDVIFWREYFDFSKYKIESVDGKEELRKYIRRIQNGACGFIIACDSDYSNYIDEFEHPLIVKTIGYSIENTIYCPKNINNMIRKRARKDEDYDVTGEIEDLLRKFFVKLKRLFACDILNIKKRHSIDVLGDSCVRFLVNNRSVSVDAAKVNECIEKIKFTNAEIDEVEKIIDADERNVWLIPRGHFLTSEIINIIKYFIKKSTDLKDRIDKTSLYAETIECPHICRKNCNDRKMLQKRVSSAIIALDKVCSNMYRCF